MKKKTSQNNNSDKKVPKNSFRKRDMFWRTPEQIIALGKDFKEWCKAQAYDPKSKFMLVERFWLDRDINQTTPQTWCAKFPEFKEDYEMGKAYLGIKKIEGAITKEYDPRSATFMAHNYLPSWGKAEKYHADLKNVKDAVAQLLGVEFEVPKLEEDKE